VSAAQVRRGGKPIRRRRKLTRNIERQAQRIAKKLEPKTTADNEALERARAKRERRAARNRQLGGDAA